MPHSFFIFLLSSPFSVFVIVPACLAGCPNKPGREHAQTCSLYSARLYPVWATFTWWEALSYLCRAVSQPTSPHAAIKGSREARRRVCHVSERLLAR